MVGIVGYGAYIPRYRIKVEGRQGLGSGCAQPQKGSDAEKNRSPVRTRTPSPSRWRRPRTPFAGRASTPPRSGPLRGLRVAPYAVKPSGTAVAGGPRGRERLATARTSPFACKAGSEGMFLAFGLVEIGRGGVRPRHRLRTPSQGAPGDALEYSAAAGGAAFLMGKTNVVASWTASSPT